MNLLTVENISKSYGELVLFDNLSFGINKDQKIALIAKNGTGKTSILNILSGADTPDSGQVNYRKSTRVSFLAQEPNMDPNLTIEETIFASDNEVLEVIKNYEKALQNPEDADAYQKAFEAMDRFEAWDFETQYKQILSKLKLDDLSAKVDKLSGGQKKRLALANALINKPDLLVLDEPTNHLDLEMIEWLEEFFAKENMTLFMVTHDRYFLERVCNEIIELENGKLYPYKGNYSYYLEKKEARIEQEAVEHHKTELLFKKELAWMRRQPKARTTKSKSRIDDFAVIKDKASQRRKDHQIQLELNMERMGSKILELHKISKSFPNKPILDKFEYYTQKGIKIKEGQKVIDVIREFGDYIPLMKGKQISAQQLLERFLFDRKKQYDFVDKLSGGERKRLYLCTILIQNPNFLILDEPTNDLDIVTLNVLESFLMDFQGCLMVVSHDRYFMDKIVDHLFVFRGDAVIEDFPGNYSDYRAYEDSQIQEKREQKESQPTNKTNWKEADTGTKISYAEQQEFKKLEREIQKLEKSKVALQEKFTDGSLSGDDIKNLSIELNDITDAIDRKTERWFELSALMEG